MRIVYWPQVKYQLNFTKINIKETLNLQFTIIYILGSVPKNLDVFNAAPLNVKQHVTDYKTIDDFEKLKQIVDKKKSIAIVGGGFLGSELACALIKYGIYYYEMLIVYDNVETQKTKFK